MLGNALAGRKPGVHLNAAGRAQAEKLAERLAGVPIDVIYSSPMERTRETAEPTAAKLGLDVHICDGIIELDLGDWTGAGYRELMDSPVWRQFNSFRSGTRIPGGHELTVEVQARMAREMENLRARHPDSIIALFSHGDPIKTAIAHYLGIPLDYILRFTIDPASVSVISVEDYGPRILCINNTDEVPVVVA